MKTREKIGLRQVKLDHFFEEVDAIEIERRDLPVESITNDK